MHDLRSIWIRLDSFICHCMRRVGVSSDRAVSSKPGHLHFIHVRQRLPFHSPYARLVSKSDLSTRRRWRADIAGVDIGFTYRCLRGQCSPDCTASD